MMEQKYYEEENRILREQIKNLDKRHNDLLEEYKDAVKKYDELVMEKLQKETKGQ